MITGKRRRRRNVAHSFEEDVAARAAKLAEQAESIAPGPERERVEARIRELKTAVQMSDWLRPPGALSDGH
jgi:hypothetical protein